MGMRIVTVVGARPQFVKAATVSRQIIALNDRLPSAEDRVTEIIVHTGQHYDAEMSDIFFKELQIPAPQHNLGVGSGSHAFQTARMLEGIEKVLLAERPEMVLIYGDTNSALAGALAAAKLHIPIAHVEAGLRSRNRKMAEEINRIVADHLASFLFCPVQAAVENLRQEGITQGVFFVGDVMYDSLIFNLELASVTSKVLEVLNLPPQSYYLATVHRAENTDDLTRLRAIFRALNQLDAIVVLPMHPRTRKIIYEDHPSAFLSELDNLMVIEPQGYLDALVLQRHAKMILTDSGGMQKEAYFLGRPCITLRDETEWGETVAAGWNIVVGADDRKILEAVERFANHPPRSQPDAAHLFGDGNASEKIVQTLLSAHAHPL